MASQAVVTPIQAAQLEEVGQFLHDHLNRRFTARAWSDALRHPWCEAPPNFGFQLRDGGRLVGVLCAIYSDQAVGGRTEKFCNPHSWCVLDQYRNQGIGLVLAAVKQRGYHFTMLTPNPKVAEIFRHLKFKDLDAATLVFPNVPSARRLFRGGLIETHRDRIGMHLSGSDQRDFELHRQISWLHFVVVGQGTDRCLVAYKPTRWKRMPCARLVHVSNAEAFERLRGLVQHGLLSRGLLLSHVEQRFVMGKPPLALTGKRGQAKLFLSPTLRDSQIRDLYSELAALDV
jgi:hypothetical protein